MNANRKSAVIVGILFLFGFAGAITLALTKPILDDSDFLNKISVNANQIILGAFFQFVMVGVCGYWSITLPDY